MTSSLMKKPNIPLLLPKAFAQWLVEQYPNVPDRDKLFRLCEAVSIAAQQKHSCLDIELVHELNDVHLQRLMQGITVEDIHQFSQCGIKPLVFSADAKSVWLKKYHYFESNIAHRLLEMAKLPYQSNISLDQMNEDLDRFFPMNPEHNEQERAGVLAQKQAVITAVQHRLAVITGGPGTGKTHTVARLIALLAKHNQHLSIMLAAPTGKAAQRMKEALATAFSSNLLSDIQYVKLPEKAYTIDSLLGIKFHTISARRNALHPLPCDILIVDEASMIAAPMMHRMLNALRPDAKLIMLGDADQLASVEAGSVLGDICASPALQDQIAHLSYSRRFGSQPEIGAAANWLTDPKQYPEPEWQNNKAVKLHYYGANAAYNQPFAPIVKRFYNDLNDCISTTNDIVSVLVKHKNFQLLCAHREGVFGVDGINAVFDQSIGKKQLWYRGRPVMVNRNDHDKKLFNGDVGLVLPVSACGQFLDVHGQLKVCFLVEGGFRAVSLAQMPSHESCYAITIHKSQGSEYAHVAIVLPGTSKDGRFQLSVTRELIYTAVTRAKESIDIWCDEGELEYAATMKTLRMSKLAWMLNA